MSSDRAFLGLFASFAVSVGFSAPVPQGQATPLYRITIERTIPAITYRPNSSTNVDFQGTALAARVEGKARVSAERGTIRVDAEFEKLPAPWTIGPEFLTYVLWAISPEGRARNMGEVALKGDKGELKASTSLSGFGMMLTAEPYFAVSVPSEVVVAENAIRSDTTGSISKVDAKFELLKRGDYAQAGIKPVSIDPKVPLDLYQARNAVIVAKSAGADRYSADSLTKATNALQNAEGYQSRKGDNRRSVVMSAREAIQAAEDARGIAVQRAAEEHAAMLKAEQAKREADAAQREADAKAQTAREAQQKRDAEQAAALAKAQAELETQRKRAAEQAAALANAEAGRQKAEAERQAQQAALADAARARAELEQERAKREADLQRREREAADVAKLKAESEKQELRAALLKQFNAILETRDTARGLVVNMGDVLFDTGKFDLRPPAREALARLSGTVASYPGLKLEIEGHTDSTGSDELNQELSEKRADSVRRYLVEQRLSPDSITSKGFGKTMPVSSNDTAQGRQQNRRVEIVVSGEVIGVNINAPAR